MISVFGINVVIDLVQSTWSILDTSANFGHVNAFVYKWLKILKIKVVDDLRKLLNEFITKIASAFVIVMIVINIISLLTSIYFLIKAIYYKIQPENDDDYK